MVNDSLQHEEICHEWPAVFSAIEFAAEAHRGKCRKGTKIPYIIHPLSAAKILIQNNCAEELVVAAILHDTIEDAPVTIEQIRESFGDTVARLVEGVSEPEHDKKSWEDRKGHTIEYLKTAPMNILLISCADKLDNIKSTKEDYGREGDEIWKRFRRGKEKQRWYYRSLADVFISRIDEGPSETMFRQYKEEVEKVFPRD